MKARITPEQIADLKARVPLASLIGESIALEKNGAEYLARCPFHSEDTPSFRVFPADSKGASHAHCFGCGWHGDAIDWLLERGRMSFMGAVRHLREWSGLAEPAERELPTGPCREALPWLAIFPVPADAPELVSGGLVRAFNPKRAKTSWEWTRWRPVLTHSYRLADGALAGFVLRVEYWKDGKRHKFTPTVTYCQHTETGDRRWCVLHFPRPRPLYRLDALASRSGDTVLLCEGEKAADAAQRLLPSLVAMTWPGGSKSYHLADFAPLRGRKVVCVPDADKEGRAAFAGRTRRGKAVPGILGILAGIGAEVRLVEPPASLPSGWDLADAEAEGWDTARTLSWLRAHLAGARRAA